MSGELRDEYDETLLRRGVRAKYLERYQGGIMIKALAIEFNSERLADLCRENGIRRLSLFGSVLRDDFSRDSDVDVLVEFLPGRIPGLHFFTIQGDLAAIFGRKVDLNTPEDLSVSYRARVCAEAEPVYVTT